jgi:hypothetical protein
MDGALVVTALLMGLAGGPHCAAMCGSACNAVAGRGGALSRPMLALHAGRVVGYAAAGALVAGSVSSLGAFETAAPMLRPLWGMVHVGAIALGVWLLWAGTAPRWLALPGPRLAALAEARPIRIVRTLPAPARAGLAGVCWAIVPCGLLQSALLVAALASGPAPGAAVMAAFALASTAGLWLAQGFWLGLHRAGDGRRFAALSVRLAGALLIGSSGFALWHGLGAALCGVAT